MSAPTLTDYAVAALLDHFFGATVKTAPVTFYVKLMSAGVELTGNGYARLAITNNTTNFPNTAARLKALAVAAAFAAATGAWSSVDGWELMDASSGGNAWLSGDTQDFAKLCRGAATGDTLTFASHGFSDGTAVRVEAPTGHSLPTGLAVSTTYYVVSTATNTFQLAATSGGAAIDLTADGLALVAAWYGKTGIVATDVYQLPVSGIKVKIATAALA